MFSYLMIFLVSISLLGLSAFIILCFVLLAFTKPHPNVKRYEQEFFYKDPKTNERLKFTDINEEHSINLSVVVPAYNEENRLKPMLDEAIEYLESRLQSHPSYTYEIIVVSDGSKDKTVEITESYSERYGCDKVRCLELIKNRGKGGAVRLGVQSSRGATILFADADGATKFADLAKLETELTNMIKSDATFNSKEASSIHGIVIGSRAHLEKESLATRSFFRNVLMYGFHFLVWLFTVRGIKDTQCGFKLFTRKSARICFKSLHVDRWAFDVELLYIAQKLNIPIAEVSVRWTEIDGSKVTPVWSWIQMGCDLGLIWLRYSLGAWKLQDSDKLD